MGFRWACGAGFGFLQVGIFGQADFHGTHAVVQRQVQQIIPLRFGDARDQGGGVSLGGGLADAEPMPAFFGFDVEIKSAHAGGGHVRHGEPRGSQRPLGSDRRGIRGEPQHQTGGMPAQTPHRRPHGLFRFRGQAIERSFQVRPALAFHIGQAGIVPADVLFFVPSPLGGIDLLAREGHHRAE